MPKILIRIALLLCFSLILASPLHADSYTEDSSNSPAFKKPSSSKTSTVTTQKTYGIKNDGTTSKSFTQQYAHQPFHEVFEDSDGDGRFGESEGTLVDTDGDGVAGESENQLGNESVTQNQKITVLNNMNMGNLSQFKAAGQIQRSSIYKNKSEKEEKTTAEKSAKPIESPAPVKAKVLVS